MISTQPPSFAIQHERHVSVFSHHHRIYYDLEDAHVAAGFADELLHRKIASAVRELDQPLFEGVSRFLAASEEVAGRLERFNGLSENVDVYHAGVAFRGDEPAGRDARHGDDWYAICVARHEFPKRSELFIQALKYLPENRGVARRRRNAPAVAPRARRSPDHRRTTSTRSRRRTCGSTRLRSSASSTPRSTRTSSSSSTPRRTSSTTSTRSRLRRRPRLPRGLRTDGRRGDDVRPAADRLLGRRRPRVVRGGRRHGLRRRADRACDRRGDARSYATTPRWQKRWAARLASARSASRGRTPLRRCAVASSA